MRSTGTMFGVNYSVYQFKRNFTHSSTRIYRLKRSIDESVAHGKLSELNLREANEYDPRMVIRAVESCYTDGFPKDEGILREYLRALVLTNTLYSRSLRSLIETPGANTRDETLNNKILNLLDRKEVYLKVDEKNPINVVINPSTGTTIWKIVKRALSLGTLALFFGSFVIMFNQNLQRGMKHSFKVITPDESDTTFDDVKGCDEVREELEEVIQYLKNPAKFSRLGAKLPKGILLAGRPGTGKTLLARALASEAGVPFIHASGSEFEEMFVGVGARRIRDLFKTAKTIAPCIVFIDELDAVGSKRTSTDHNTMRMTLNQLLVELDGFAKQEGIVVLCATNFPESLDPALVRPGRLDKTVYIPLPDLKGRLEILKLYASKLILSSDIDLNVVAKRTVGMTGADLFNILNTAALKCSMQGLSSITAAAVEEAFDRVVVGLKGKSLVNERERRSTAYHEGGHTLVSMHTDGATKVHKATILPRGNTLGATWKIPEEKKDTRMNELKAEIDVLMGGMAAEEVIYGKENVTTGCQSDLKRATEIAKTLVNTFIAKPRTFSQLVMQFGVGLKDVVGPMFVDHDSYHELSEELRKKIDSTVQSILDESYVRAVTIIKNNVNQLHRLSKALVEYETLSYDEIIKAIEGRMDDIGTVRSKADQKAKVANIKIKATGDLIPETQHSFKSR
ncbi:metallopeptidase [Theileria orientalis strain Shintoku]|uniref:Metallopeptidase n=1 Tax=Theileria orientalis strain Shintoku TaxID=869250 RepID=J4C4E5_THEOR|nr:metallopeptidase [Theileria orientalis strain Shintoku]BAM42046.1 metallopeptidase [Theileria orientalis strain Shintoku]|eukprot:XP_009692347.1 metallopeptidase [Theileria orientalis strain Shintoku]